MSASFIIFNKETGTPVSWGSASAQDISLQAVKEEERLLVTSSFDVEVNKNVVYDDVKAIRQTLIDGGAQTSFGVVDTDLFARTNLTGAAVAALIALQSGQPYSVTWALKNNTSITLTAPEMLQFALEAVGYIDACFSRSFVLRDEINAATNMAELLAIDITAGWPGQT